MGAMSTRARLKRTWMETIKKGILILLVIEEVTLNKWNGRK